MAKIKKLTKQKTIKKMKIVGTEEYVNKETGEMIQTQTVKMESRDFNFEKLWLVHILESLEAVGNQKIKVMNTLLEIKNSDNMIIATQRALAEKAQVGLNTVNETLNILIDTNFIRKVQSGVYMINPDIMFKGTKNNRMNILLEYSKPDPMEEETQISENPDVAVISERPKELKNDKKRTSK